MKTFKIYDADLTDIANDKFESYEIDIDCMTDKELNEHYKNSMFVALYELLASFNLGLQKFKYICDNRANYTFCGNEDDIKNYLSECFGIDDFDIINNKEFHC